MKPGWQKTYASVLSVLSRLLEKPGHDQVSNYLKVHKKFSKYQHVFLKMHSTLTSPDRKYLTIKQEIN